VRSFAREHFVCTKGAKISGKTVSKDLQNERVEQVKFGNALERESIESRAQLLQAKQGILTTRRESCPVMLGSIDPVRFSSK
jgi:hypothetical protein